MVMMGITNVSTIPPSPQRGEPTAATNGSVIPLNPHRGEPTAATNGLTILLNRRRAGPVGEVGEEANQTPETKESGPLAGVAAGAGEIPETATETAIETPGLVTMVETETEGEIHLVAGRMTLAETDGAIRLGAGRMTLVAEAALEEATALRRHPFQGTEAKLAHPQPQRQNVLALQERVSLSTIRLLVGLFTSGTGTSRQEAAEEEATAAGDDGEEAVAGVEMFLCSWPRERQNVKTHFAAKATVKAKNKNKKNWLFYLKY